MKTLSVHKSTHQRESKAMEPNDLVVHGVGWSAIIKGASKYRKGVIAFPGAVFALSFVSFLLKAELSGGSDVSLHATGTLLLFVMLALAMSIVISYGALSVVSKMSFSTRRGGAEAAELPRVSWSYMDGSILFMLLAVAAWLGMGCKLP